MAPRFMAWPARWVRRGWTMLAALVLCASVGPAAAQPLDRYTDRPGPYLLFLAGGSQYEFDCRSDYYYYDDCAYGRAGAGKVGLGYSFGRIGVEGTWTDYGRARIDNGRTPRDSLRMQALGVNAVFSLPFGPASEGLLRVGLADVRHSRSDDVGAQHVFTASVGLAFVLHLGPQAALEVGWDATTGEGRNTGTTVAGALLAGLRLSF
ncbi:MAG: hypothetical protein KIT17_20275 [Rubrivivax sp.]|nr:hypothetical protein [Rubrivivax sp.]